MDKIKTFEEACAAKGLDPLEVMSVAAVLPAEIEKQTSAFMKLLIIVSALNGDWTPDWNDNDQEKWYPWFDMEKSEDNPSGFCLSYVDWNYSSSFVPSRLCFRSRELAEYAVETFGDLYRYYFTI